ncbi:UdgX family uracil-DNA binding protein [Glycomyces buryatensis]|uniref:Type-4 uracil-DNA glycosylase n=1 Tax=Glycomyces buryatensis TaxID=2570927 RepID=A0A4S8Q614_9ACTN|nr:UdgX family uracil-DNA binding protein [Glycomyces buryatensis]THV39540.1 uracil-DNA glycosylase [Glycomyces buryatensis]
MTPKTLGADRFVPPGAGIERLEEAAETCEGCELHRDATQTVFGDGSATARIALVGEQPGDDEDRSGRPFTGPSGTLLYRALDQAGIDRGECYVTNAVKHFKFAQLQPGGRRIHKTPTRGEVNACRPWLLAELNAVKPELVVVLGATAGQSLMGPEFRISTRRGIIQDLVHDGLAESMKLMGTVHPSAVLRLRESERKEAFAQMLVDLRKAADFLETGHEKAG